MTALTKHEAGAVPAASGYAALAAFEGDQTVAERAARWLAGLSESTQRAYGHELRAFAKWLGSVEGRELSIGQAMEALAFAQRLDAHPKPTTRMLERYAAAMAARGLKTVTMRRAVAALQSALAMLARDGVGPGRQSVLIEGGAASATERDGPATGDVSAVLVALKRGGLVQDLRDRAMVELMARAGLRRVEVTRMTVADFEPDQCRIQVVGKGKLDAQGREVRQSHPIAPATCQALSSWVAVRSTVAAEGETALFVSVNGRTKGGRLGRKAINDALAKVGVRVVGMPIEPHDLRRVSVTQAVKRLGIDAAQTHARHARSETTRRYVLASERAEQGRRVADALGDAF